MRLLYRIAFVLLASASALFAIPQIINYQGQVTRPDGTLLDSTVAVVFRIYAAPINGAALWTEAHPAVVVTDGLFQVRLGSVTPFSSSTFSPDSAWLGLTIGNDSEQFPRMLFTSVSFALVADDLTRGTVRSLNNLQDHVMLSAIPPLQVTVSSDSSIVVSIDSTFHRSPQLRDTVYTTLSSPSGSWEPYESPLIIHSPSRGRLIVSGIATVRGIANETIKIGIDTVAFGSIADQQNYSQLGPILATGNVYFPVPLLRIFDVEVGTLPIYVKALFDANSGFLGPVTLAATFYPD